MKLGLGTVQFGVDYGISNSAGQTPAPEVARILALAQQKGVRLLDTALLYGASEEALGRALPAGHGFQVVTKTLRFDAGAITAARVALMERGFLNSLDQLRAPSLYGLLIHNADDLLLENGHLLLEKLLELKQRGLVRKVGVSVYSARQIDRVLELFAPDIVQLPVNVLDQRLLQDGRLDALKQAGVEVHARSVFLQGLLLMEPDALPPYFDPIRGHLARYREMLRARGITPLAAALGFVAGLEQVDYLICGVNDHLQLEEICSALNPAPARLFAPFSLTREDMLNPAQWRVQ